MSTDRWYKEQPEWGTPESTARARAMTPGQELDEKGKGLWANIHAKRKRGEKPNPPGHPDRPTAMDLKRSQKKEAVGDEDVSSLSHRRLSTIMKDPNHPMHTHAKSELDRRKITREAKDPEEYDKEGSIYIRSVRDYLESEKMEESTKMDVNEVEQIDELTAAEKKLVSQMYDKKGNLTPMGKKVMNHGKKRGDKGYVESVNELSKDTMQSYWDKTKSDDAFSGTRKANNRLKGAINVTTKLDRLKKMVKK